MTTYVYGYSDDLIEVQGDTNEEHTANYNEPTEVVVEGVRIRATYGTQWFLDVVDEPSTVQTRRLSEDEIDEDKFNEYTEVIVIEEDDSGPVTELNDYQDQTSETAIFPSEMPESELVNYAEVSYCAMGLAGETGEVVEKVKKAVREDDLSYLDDLQDELGDVLWYWAQLAELVELDADYIAQRNLQKLTDRQERDQLTGEGDDR